MNVVDRLLLGSYNDVNTMMQCACSLVLFDGTPRWRIANVVTSHACSPSIERGVIKTACTPSPGLLYSLPTPPHRVRFYWVVDYPRPPTGLFAYKSFMTGFSLTCPPSEDQGVVNFLEGGFEWSTEAAKQVEAIILPTRWRK